MGLLKMETVVLFDIIDRNYGKLTIEMLWNKCVASVFWVRGQGCDV